MGNNLNRKKKHMDKLETQARDSTEVDQGRKIITVQENKNQKTSPVIVEDDAEITHHPRERIGDIVQEEHPNRLVGLEFLH